MRFHFIERIIGGPQRAGDRRLEKKPPVRGGAAGAPPQPAPKVSAKPFVPKPDHRLRASHL